MRAINLLPSDRKREADARGSVGGSAGGSGRLTTARVAIVGGSPRRDRLRLRSDSRSSARAATSRRGRTRSTRSSSRWPRRRPRRSPGRKRSQSQQPRTDGASRQPQGPARRLQHGRLGPHPVGSAARRRLARDPGGLVALEPGAPGPRPLTPVDPAAPPPTTPTAAASPTGFVVIRLRALAARGREAAPAARARPDALRRHAAAQRAGERRHRPGLPVHAQRQRAPGRSKLMSLQVTPRTLALILAGVIALLGDRRLGRARRVAALVRIVARRADRGRADEPRDAQDAGRADRSQERRQQGEGAREGRRQGPVDGEGEPGGAAPAGVPDRGRDAVDPARGAAARESVQGQPRVVRARDADTGQRLRLDRDHVTVNGRYQSIQRFVHALRVQAASVHGRVHASGRLFAVETVQIAPAAEGAPSLSATHPARRVRLQRRDAGHRRRQRRFDAGDHHHVRRDLLDEHRHQVLGPDAVRPGRRCGTGRGRCCSSCSPCCSSPCSPSRCRA